ncbi:hypothetical protein GmarT_48350 [Gimesia maris]|uniref:Uncharacterized protein n=1 Tax=Gimesia maris TaxID=122 RepID=A0ABX5YTC7_9PLAN|nr:hypothetical protein GmarT_48350 [Gimesia maris]
MYCNFVSLILIPFVLLTQSVTFGHSHAGNQPVGHDLRTHIHLDLSAEKEQHGHGHSHGTHCHVHEEHADADQGQPATPEVESPFDHDSSAVYLNRADLSCGPRSTLKTELLVSFYWNVIDADPFSCPIFGVSSEWRRPDCASPGPESLLFLRHHAFLI